jgi:hypothetical protein
MTTLLLIYWTRLRTHLDLLRDDDPEAGYSTETVVVTALLVALALLVVGDIIYNKVVNKANSIQLG